MPNTRNCSDDQGADSEVEWGSKQRQTRQKMQLGKMHGCTVIINEA